MILEEGVTVQPVSLPNDQAQWIEAMRFSKGDIASIFRVPPHMIGIFDGATFSNIEQQALEFEKYCIQPWCTRIEGALSHCLFTAEEQEIYSFKFNLDALRRGAFLERQQGLAIQRNLGIISADEWRSLENRNPLPNKEGSGYLQPMNMTLVGEKDTVSTVGEAPPSVPADSLKKN
jgi:HK97 family phage portal protein